MVAGGDMSIGIPYAELMSTRQQEMAGLNSALNALFGSAENHNNGHGVARSGYTKEDIPRLVIAANPLITSNMASSLHHINAVTLMLHFTEAIRHVSTEFVEKAIAPGLVPAYGAAKTHLIESRQVISKSHRYGHGVEIEGDFKLTEEGRDYILHIINMFANLGNEGMQNLAINAIRLAEVQDVYSGSLDTITDKVVYDTMLREQIGNFGCVNKSMVGLEKIAACVKSELKRTRNIELNEVYMPHGKGELIRQTGNPQMIDYALAGPAGPDRLAGNVKFATVCGLTVVSAPIPLDARDKTEKFCDAEDALGRLVVIGDFAHFKRYNGMNGALEWFLFAASDDRYVGITFDDMFVNNQRFVHRKAGENLNWDLNSLLPEGATRFIVGSNRPDNTLAAPFDGWYFDVERMLKFMDTTHAPINDKTEWDPFLIYGVIDVLPDEDGTLTSAQFRRYTVSRNTTGHKSYYINPDYLFRSLSLLERGKYFREAALADFGALEAKHGVDIAKGELYIAHQKLMTFVHKGKREMLAQEGDVNKKKAIEERFTKLLVELGRSGDLQPESHELLTEIEAHVPSGTYIPPTPTKGFQPSDGSASDAKFAEKRAYLEAYIEAWDMVLNGLTTSIPAYPKNIQDGEKLKDISYKSSIHTLCGRPSSVSENSVRPWSEYVEHLAFRPCSTYRMQDIIFVAGGPALGYTAHSQQNVFAAHDASHDVWQLQWRAWLGTHIKDYNRIVCISNAIYNGIEYGCNGLVITEDEANQYDEDSFILDTERSPSVYSICIPIAHKWTVRDMYIHLLGNSRLDSQDAQSEYPGAAFYSEVYHWRKSLSKSVINRTAGGGLLLANVLFRASLKYMTSGGMHHESGSTHHGPIEGAGCGAIRRTGDSVIHNITP